MTVVAVHRRCPLTDKDRESEESMWNLREPIERDIINTQVVGVSQTHTVSRPRSSRRAPVITAGNVSIGDDEWDCSWRRWPCMAVAAKGVPADGRTRTWSRRSLYESGSAARTPCRTVAGPL